VPEPLAPVAIGPAWLAAIDDAARILLGPHDRTGAALSTEVARLSELYTRDRGALRTQAAALGARLRFFLPRDLPKIEGPLCELAWASVLPRGPRWRVLDLGAGLGASTLGIASFARRAGIEGLDVLAVEREPRAIDVLRHLAARTGHGALAADTVPVALESRELDLERIDVRALGSEFSFAVLGLSLNELWTDAPDRLDRRAELLRRLTSVLAPDGALVVIEPALAASARDLQRVRDRAVALGLHVVAPCTHAAPCPMLAAERHWCHEDLDLALPEPLRSIARGAGLRWEGLTYAALVLRREPAAGGGHRIVGGPIETKGRTEWHACGEGGLVRIARLTRHRGADPLEGARRGSRVRLPPDAGASVRTDRAAIERLR